MPTDMPMVVKHATRCPQANPQCHPKIRRRSDTPKLSLETLEREANPPTESAPSAPPLRDMRADAYDPPRGIRRSKCENSEAPVLARSAELSGLCSRVPCARSAALASCR